jgi:hypothetical protein
MKARTCEDYDERSTVRKRGEGNSNRSPSVRCKLTVL